MNGIHLFIVRLVAAALIPFATLSCQQKEIAPEISWWDDSWSDRLRAVIDTTEEGVPIKGESMPATVLVRLHSGNFPFSSARSDGADLRFVAADDRSVWPHRIERYDELLEEAFVWVKVPEIPVDGVLEFRLYYGNAEPSFPNPPDEAYGDELILVYHFAETWSTELNPEGIPPRDATSHQHHAEGAGLPVESALIGGGSRLNPLHPVRIPPSDALAWTAGGRFSLSVWISPEGTESSASILRREEGETFFDLGLDQGSPYLEVQSSDVDPGANGRIRGETTVVSPGSWCHLVVVADEEGIGLWIDGAEAGRLDGGLPPLEAPLLLASPGEGNVFTGQIDELRLAGTAWCGSEVALAYFNQGPDPRSARLLRLEPDLATPSAPAMNPVSRGYFQVIMETLNWDGWAIIFVLFLMAAASWIVILFKSAHLNTVDRANHHFVRLWNRLADDLGALDSQEKIEEAAHAAGGKVSAESVRHSPLYHLYRAGWDQVALRLGSLHRDGSPLSGLAVQAIRAAMFATCTREIDKLNTRLVVLTIAISGAPFLGLLGTVLGVTITFASIAAAGEVNVNTIAPGIAAALTTTIVGLCVAIPALFGYNCLVLPIKRMSSEMRIFVDEFITRVAEAHSETAKPPLSPTPSGTPAQVASPTGSALA